MASSRLLRHFKSEIEKRNNLNPIVQKNNIPYLVDQHLLDKKMLKLKVNDIDVEVEDGLTVLQALKKQELRSKILLS